MSESIKLNNNKYVDATGVWDSTAYNQAQSAVNLRKMDGKSLSTKDATLITQYTFAVNSDSAKDIYAGMVYASAWANLEIPTVYIFRYRVSANSICFSALNTETTNGKISSMAYSNGVLELTFANAAYRFINLMIF